MMMHFGNMTVVVVICLTSLAGATMRTMKRASCSVRLKLAGDLSRAMDTDRTWAVGRVHLGDNKIITGTRDNYKIISRTPDWYS